MTCSVKDGEHFGQMKDLVWEDENGMPIRLFKHGNSGLPMDSQELFRWIYVEQNGYTPEDKMPSESVSLWVVQVFSIGELWLDAGGRTVAVSKVKLGFEVCSSEITVDNVEHYRSEHQDIAHRVQWKGELVRQKKPISLTIEAMIKSRDSNGY